MALLSRPACHLLEVFGDVGVTGVFGPSGWWRVVLGVDDRRVGTEFDEQHCNRKVAAQCRFVQRCGSAPGVNVEPEFDEQPDRGEVRGNRRRHRTRFGWTVVSEGHVGYGFGVVSRVSHTTIDCHDAYLLSTWWKPIVGYTDAPGDANEPGDEECLIVDPRTGHELLFVEVPDPAPRKRIHLDLAPIDRSRDDEVIRVVALGATWLADRRRSDGTGWVVLGDPEGNEFCVVRSDTEREEQRSRSFADADLSGTRFVRCYFDGATFRGVALSNVSVDGEIDGLTINGVDIAPLVEAELNRRFPGRELRHGTSCAQLQESWEKVQAAWSDAVTLVRGLPPHVMDTGVDSEWSFLQTLRHLIMATDVWLRGAVQRIDPPYHPIGQPFSEYETDGYDTSHFTETAPSLERVLEVRAERQAMVTEFLATTDDRDLTDQRVSPWANDRSVTVGHCINIVLNEEWEHLRFALRDINVPRSTGSF
jgi:Glyoxalase-like domain/DinB superfamily/Pentapeptide repeats (8 copies)